MGALGVGRRCNKPFLMSFKASVGIKIVIIMAYMGVCIPRSIRLAIVPGLSDESHATIASDYGPVFAFLVMVYPIVSKGGGTAFSLATDGTGFGSSLGTGGGSLVPAMGSGGGNRAGFRLAAAGAAPGFRTLGPTGGSLGLRPTLPAVI